MRLERDGYLDLIERLELQTAVTLLDHYIPNEKVPFCFSAADVVVLPYVHATQSAVLQLAFGCGRPVITSAASQPRPPVRSST